MGAIITGAELIAEERERQKQERGFTAQHDAQHTEGELAAAAMSYMAQGMGIITHGTGRPPFWPWDISDWKPEDSQLENYIKAGALVAAEIDRIIATSIVGRTGAAE